MRSKRDAAPGRVSDGDVPETAHRRVYADLKKRLMSGDFVPGQRLVVRHLAEQFETSAMPVREALRQLVSDEALYDHPNRGVIVPEATVDTIGDLTRVRCKIEGTAVEWAAATISTAELEQLEHVNAAMGECVRVRAMAEYLTLNRRFHFTIYRAARSVQINQIIERMWLRAGPWLNLVRDGTMAGTGLHHHEEMIAALRSGDGNAARRALVADITDAADVILRAAATPLRVLPKARRRPDARIKRTVTR